MAFIRTISAFPFCQVDSRAELPVAEITVPEPYYPCQVSYDKAFEWYWRVKQWRMDYTVSYVIDDSPWTGTFSHTGSLVSNEIGGDEEDLVCSDGLSFSASEILAGGLVWTHDTDPPYTEDVPVSFYLQYMTTDPRWKRAGDDWLPYILSFGNFGRDGDLGWNTGIVLSVPYSATLDGEAMQTYYEPAGNVTVSTMIFSLSPELYWEYDPGTGGPVWDAASGSQLRNPFSVLP